MTRTPFFALACVLGGCHDWGAFSRNYGHVSDAGAMHCPTDALLCDDFESATLAANWATQTMGGSPSLDGTRASSGARSLRVHVDALAAHGAMNASIGDESVLAHPPPRSFYARVMVSGAPLPGEFGLLTAQSSGGRFDGLHVGVVASGGLELTDWANGDDAPDKQVVFAMSSAHLDTTGWSCLEWQVVEGSAGQINGGATVWLDGNQLGELTMSTGLVTWPSDLPLGVFMLGANVADAPASSSAFDVWFDDLAIATTRIGCPTS